MKDGYVHIVLHDSEVLEILEALKQAQKSSLDKLREDFDSIRAVDKEYHQMMPAVFARIMRKFDTAYDDSTSSS